ncbi:class I SAM-dependent methyltransferase [Paenibacillus assamensis]|uniref:class I SAM-dependent methyltransferase n=1 Tax=Paenibacillus assamensis TaxID=311244 RepID=UPI0004067492|nr:class I SAM-dependent methyltransferase [Paenibacillus assamensis]
MDIKKQVLQQFGQHASKYVSSQTHAKGKDLDLLVMLALSENHSSVLDIATGGGHVANALAPYAKHIVAYDMTPEILASAESFITGNGHQHIQFVEGDAEKLPFADHSFDIITCRIAAHHFPDVHSFIQESYRVLKRNGRLLIIDNVAPESDLLDQFYNTVEKKRDPSHNRAFKKGEWMYFLESSGFTIESMYTFPKTFAFDEWFKRMGQSDQVRQELTQLMLEASYDTQHYFRIQTSKQQIISFRGQSALIQAKKEV